MMQQEFTGYALPRLLDHFPQFASGCINKPGHIVDINYQSRQGNLTLRVTTQGQELTVGFAADAEHFAWHLHMSQHGATTPEEEIRAAIQLLTSILSDQKPILYSSFSGYFLPEDVDDAHEDQHPSEVVQAFFWSEL